MKKNNLFFGSILILLVLTCFFACDQVVSSSQTFFPPSHFKIVYDEDTITGTFSDGTTVVSGQQYSFSMTMPSFTVKNPTAGKVAKWYDDEEFLGIGKTIDCYGTGTENGDGITHTITYT